MPSREEIENKFFVAGQMDAQGHAAEKMKIGSGGTVLAMSWRFLSEARSLMDEFESEIAALRAENARLRETIIAWRAHYEGAIVQRNVAEAQLTALQAENARSVERCDEQARYIAVMESRETLFRQEHSDERVRLTNKLIAAQLQLTQLQAKQQLDSSMPWLQKLNEMEGRALAAEAKVAALQAEQAQWQPMDTCPSEGLFLVFEDGAMRMMYRSRGEWQATAVALDQWGVSTADIPVRETGVYHPTHWMPLPKPPFAALTAQPDGSLPTRQPTP